jgi:hypothetical protein
MPLAQPICLRVPLSLGVRLLLLDVTAEGGEEVQTRLHRFYAAMGFKPLPDRPERLFLPLSALPSFPARWVRDQNRRGLRHVRDRGRSDSHGLRGCQAGA